MSAEPNRKLHGVRWFALSCWVSAFVVAVTPGCSREKQSADLKQLQWVLGTWSAETDQGHFYENWTLGGQHVLRGRGYEVEAGEKVFAENLRIEARRGGIFYVAEVAHNEGEVSFRLVRAGERQAIFENPDHDFPQRFVYRHNPDGTMYVRAETLDSSRMLEFHFVREE